MTEFQALHQKWLSEDPAYAAEHRAMESEFAFAAQRIRSRIERPRPLEATARGRHHGAIERADW